MKFKKKIKVCFIGLNNHSKIIRNIALKSGIISEWFIYLHRKGTKEEKNITNNLKDILDTDAIFILSPDHLHISFLEYIKNLDYKGYVFCEKPPVINKKNINYLKKLDYKKFFFNFNERFGRIFSNLQEIKNKKVIGDILNVYTETGHGLAFKSKFKNSWRPKKLKKNLMILTKSIHHIDMFNLLFSNLKKVSHLPTEYKQKNIYGSSCANFISNKTIFTFFSSYYSPYINLIRIIGTNGYLEILKNKIKIYYPRNFFDKEKRFTHPPLKKVINLNNNYYKDSLKKSVDYFLDICIKKKSFKRDFLENSISTMELILN